MEKGAGERSGRFCYLSTTEMLGTNFPLRLTALGNGLSKLTFHSGPAGVHPANLANILFTLLYNDPTQQEDSFSIIFKNLSMTFRSYLSATGDYSSSP